MEHFFLAHDIGTSCDKAALVDTHGRVYKTVTEGYPIHYGPQNQAEQEPEDWWRALCAANARLTAEVGKQRILAVAVSGQMMACLPVDRAGVSLRPAMIWADGRAVRERDELVSAVGTQAYSAITGMRPSENYALSKMLWFSRHEPKLYEKTFCFLAAKDYINCRLTGIFATDREDAAYFHAYDIVRREWSAKLLGAAGIDPEKLPRVAEPATVLGGVRAAVADEASLAPGTPVILCTGDGDAATLGAGAVEIGDAYTCIGTSSWVSVLTGEPKQDPLHRIAKADCFGVWRDSGTMQAGGFSYSWLKDMLCTGEKERARQRGRSVYALLDEAAASVLPGANGVLYLPYLLGERSPWWDSRLSGAFLGLSGGTTGATLIRAVLEGVAMHLGLIYDIIRETVPDVRPKAMRIIGGGGQSALWRQIFADVYGIPVLETNVSEAAGTLGCAVMAGVAIGCYPDLSVIRQLEKIKSVAEPVPEREKLYHERRGVLAQAVNALTPVSHLLWAARQQQIT